MNHFQHTPVLVDAVIKNALPENARYFADCTFGLGGHSKAILEHYPQLVTLIAIDRDRQILDHSCSVFDDARIQRIQARASELPMAMQQLHIDGVDGILLDLGVSSYQLEAPERGFSFSRPGPLDMRMDTENRTTAEDIVNDRERDELIKIFREYGEEKFSPRIADAIIRSRQNERITRTDQLANIIAGAVPAACRRNSSIHPATRVFQAIRIAVNHELEELEDFLAVALGCLRPGGHLSIISFHSLEDRLVKSFMQERARGCVCPPRFPVCVCGKKPEIEILTRKAVFAEESEISQNPRSRSARMRSCRKCSAKEAPRS
ncbi:MAG: 16S rRNA (cytosine(1402)-N(4))-methyltransferase [Candidatus Riflebacteria bacterium HGW-Riflebacteria-2]|jgi:16S rRNA (cytosine1402-N4)-methyltransferase|nr:MAG: 16S rRNA (cytosine(1402)-N(4))-methyltransferase [Candidatus Riflebacteria bacterium HGW-Riflebacteria-2]